jgi:DNA-directed RNA polymerase specialized sigma subunit
LNRTELELELEEEYDFDEDKLTAEEEAAEGRRIESATQDDPWLIGQILAEPPTPEENQAYYARLVAGDESAREEMVLANRRLVVCLAHTYITKRPWTTCYLDDLISGGFLKLFEVVHGKFKDLKDEGVSKYLTKSIRSSFHDTTENEQVVRVPRRQRARVKTYLKTAAILLAAAAAAADPTVVFLALAALVASERDQLDFTTEEADGQTADRKSGEEIRKSDFEALIYACCHDDVDREIVRLRKDGYKRKEVRRVMGIGKDALKTRLNRLKERVMYFYERDYQNKMEK